VRPQLEFASPAWSPWLGADKEVLEKVQKRAVNMISGLKAKTYEEKLRKLETPPDKYGTGVQDHHRQGHGEQRGLVPKGRRS
jgi:hypothetical protein